ncbi:hypothetical protein [Saccharothrix coeruleofusca]|uniref:Uncharacterized protein n=1 Tax=Saccharothrix coeruleofusca TaxID=33919 RepID=A0A918ECJ8_9PSEU|nr:hypothetical protein [Saccharothrix coeruleofusca]GGP36539.1 hypothetical protein GCM10010185_04580 [Saccharothrix coeruleofusca]
MRVLEQFVAGKAGDDEECEDSVVVTAHFVAVVDGATDKTGHRYDGMTGGRLAMLTCLEAVRTAAPDVDAAGMVGRMSAALAARLPSGVAPQERPAAAVGVYSAARREVWQVGDVAYWHRGLPPTGVRTLSAVDHFSAGVRAAVLTAELHRGVPVEELARQDVGRAAIRDVLIRQGLFRNNAEAGEWAYGAIDGSRVPKELVEVHAVAEGVRELVLASDGYPLIFPTLAETERALRGLLADDPLCIGPLRSTKGLRPGHTSFDDRAYVRIALD